ncbi:MAG: 2-(hydroxymethyl)glutarate dehydrogenase [Pseudomonadota bacterium]
MLSPVVAYIALGANLGQAQFTVRRAIQDLGRDPHTRVLRCSSLYCTAPVDATGPDFINAVVQVSTTLSAAELLAWLQSIEEGAGRERPYRNAPRTLDLDILLWGEQSIHTPSLTVPHPRMWERAFVLVPLAEIAPDRVPDVALHAVQDQEICRVSASGPVGLVGIGNMGFAMMQRLLQQGWPVRVFDVDAGRMQAAGALGAQLGTDAADVAAHCRHVLVAVVDAAQTEAVLAGPQGIYACARKGDVIFLCPTLSPLDVERAAAQCVARGLHLIDAPMSGGPARAQQGQMSLMLAAPEQVLEAEAALLQDLALQRFVISQKPGDAARTKLINNLLAAINLAGACEVIALAQQWGLDATRTLDVVEASSGQSWIGSDRLRRALQNDFEPRAHTTLLAKDSRLALETCAGLGLPAPALGALAAQQFSSACESGLSQLDDASLFLQAGGKASAAG